MVKKIIGYVGPFDARVEAIIRIFENRAGLSEDMACVPRIGNVSLVFADSLTEPFAYDKDEFREIRGEFEGKEFSISLAPNQFTQYPGNDPCFHHRSIPRIQIPRNVLFLFRLYPEYYTQVSGKDLGCKEFLDEVILRGRESEHIVGYEPVCRGYHFGLGKQEVATDCELMMSPKPFPADKKVRKSLFFQDVFSMFDEFLQSLIKHLEVAPVKTKGMTKA